MTLRVGSTPADCLYGSDNISTWDPPLMMSKWKNIKIKETHFQFFLPLIGNTELV